MSARQLLPLEFGLRGCHRPPRRVSKRIEGVPMANPFSDLAETDAEDRDLVSWAQAGSRDALERLITRHQAWIYNIVLRMLYYPHDAEDVTQEILIKLMTKLSTFEGRSSFRTWLYRIAVNHILNVKRRSFEDQLNFVEYGRGLDATPEMDLPDPNTVPVDLKLMVDEARIGCTGSNAVGASKGVVAAAKGAAATGSLAPWRQGRKYSPRAIASQISSF